MPIVVRPSLSRIEGPSQLQRLRGNSSVSQINRSIELCLPIFPYSHHIFCSFFLCFSCAPRVQVSIDSDSRSPNIMARIISVQEISKHNIPDDLWLVVDNTVYDLTEFAPEHPGGAGSMLPSLSTITLLISPLSHPALRRPRCHPSLQRDPCFLPHPNLSLRIQNTRDPRPLRAHR